MRTIISLLILVSNAAFADPHSELLGRWTTGLGTDPSGYAQHRMSYFFDESGECRVEIDVLITHPLMTSGFKSTQHCRYSLGPAVSGLSHTYEFDSIFYKAVLTPTHPNQVRSFNESRTCGFDDWQLGVARDITGLDCGDFSTEIPEGVIIYSIISIIADTYIVFGELPEGEQSEIGTRPDLRPTRLDPESLIPRNGTGGLPHPPIEEDLISGMYHVEEYRSNQDSCEVAHPAERPFNFMQILDNSSIIPLMPGWSIKHCQIATECSSTPNRINLSERFIIHERDEEQPERYLGVGTQTSWVGQCVIQRQFTETERLDDGTLIISSKTYKGTLPNGIGRDSCKTDHPLIDELVLTWPCRTEELTATRLE